MDSKSLKNCRKVSKSWQECIDNQNILWNKIVEKKGGNETFQLACKNGHSKMAEMLIQKAAEFNIELNGKNLNGLTAFHLACENGYSETAELLMQKSTELNIELNAKDKDGRTAFHLACKNGRFRIAELVIQKPAELNIDLNAKDNGGRTAFLLACNGYSEIAELLMQKSTNLKIKLFTILPLVSTVLKETKGTPQFLDLHDLHFGLYSPNH